MERKIKILALVTDAFGGQGGIAKFNRNLLTALCSYPEVEEVVAIPRLTANPPESLPERLTYVTTGLQSKIRYIFSVLGTVLRGPQFDLIFCGHIHLLFLAWIAKLLCRAPLVLIIHGIEAWKPTGRFFVDSFVKKVDALIAVSDFTRQKFLDWTHLNSTPSFILPNAVDLSQFTPGPKPSGLLKRYGLKGKKVLMTLARLETSERYKGIDEVLEVLTDLAREIPNIAYLIVGDGTDRKRLEDKAKDLQIAERVFFTCFIPESEKAEHYRLADVFVMPGWGEGFGIVYLEALACGIPVVGSTLDASREALKDVEWGLLVDPKNPEEIKSAILKILRAPNKIVIPRLDRGIHDLDSRFRGNDKEVLLDALSHVPQNVFPGVEDFSYPRFRDRLSGILYSLTKVLRK